ncbi:hypothetical protein [Spiroplasma culicicola]|uniref:DNA polymerase III subunit delta n=1 Tax=Spiroplasma culicicola AES-1 TaxID=1276246 RepID=W6A5Y4_9MOLU|nr:hypothetical protein [Spiroplasma culicicola]AHI52351.1 DNA polymerase III subunit delta' [Spiroplasma culicicola AES-1]
MNKQEIFRTVRELILSNNLYHSMIISSTDQEQLNLVVDDVVRIILCENNSIEFDGCIWCKKMNSKNALNIFFIGDGINKIKKESIKELILTFSLSNVEDSDKKIYIIRNAENLGDSASNALLKFLEEPPKNVFAILQTNDQNQIIKTIKSRCKFLNLESIKTNEVRDNDLIRLINLKTKNDILLYANDFKKLEKDEQIKILEETYSQIIINQYINLAEKFINTIQEIKNSSYTALAIDNLFINIYEVF